MTKKPFSAEQWFKRESGPLATHFTPEPATSHSSQDSYFVKSKSLFPSFKNLRDKHQNILVESQGFCPLTHLTPGWTGESLISKNVIQFQKIINLTVLDIRRQFHQATDFTRAIKSGLYEEFLSYAEALGLHAEEADEQSRFWTLIRKEDLAETHPAIERFMDIYFHRVAAVTYYKLRFVATLCDRSEIYISDKALLYPTSFLTGIFKKGSSTELKTRALESNYYSWYRPQEDMKSSMSEMINLSRKVTISEIIKTLSQKTQIQSEQDKIYSHSLSHVNFGLFLNSLLINFPLWLDVLQGTIPWDQDKDETISCKFFGDYIESLSLSHWLAQENNKALHWEQTLCSDFKGIEFESGLFTKICNELQFLTFLADKAEHQNERPIEYISKVVGAHFKNRKNTGSHQPSLLTQDNPFYSSSYDRVVLNLSHFPKNNPQHFLISQIHDQIRFVKNEGYLFVLSSKKLFIPSQRDRVEQLLKELKIEAVYDFENVKGKGELGNYIYIFKKTAQVKTAQQICYYFRLSAELNSFQEFGSLSEHIRSFYLQHLSDAPAMAQMEFPDNQRVEFFQEAIVNGMLINSTNEDASHITHPSFFKGLMDSCIPLETVFDIKPLTLEDRQDFTSGLNLGLKQDLSYFLVVSFKTDEPKLELHPMNTFRSVYNDYGAGLCSYFSLTPKLSGIDPNILRHFFKSPIGKQVIQLTFTSGTQKVKGNLSKLLVPRFLQQTDHLSENTKSAFEILNMTQDELLEANPLMIKKSFAHLEQILQSLFPRFACEILSRLARFEQTLQQMIWHMNDNRFGSVVNFNNPLIKMQLMNSETHPIYPSSPDVYIEFVESSRPDAIHLPITSFKKRTSHEGELKLHFLELIHDEEVIIRLHSDECMLCFISFLLTHANGVPFSKLLRAIQVPRLERLKTIVETTQSLKTTYTEIESRISYLISESFKIQIMLKRPV